MTFERGDIVLIGNGKVHWEVQHQTPWGVVLKSGMTGRYRSEQASRLVLWTPGA